MSHVRLPQKQSRLLVFFLCVMIIVTLVLTHTFHAKAEIAFFDALAVEEQIRDTEREGAHVPESLHEYTWSSFTGVIPEGATVESMTFMLSWIQSATLEQKSGNIDTPESLAQPSKEEGVEHEVVVNEDEAVEVHGEFQEAVSEGEVPIEVPTGGQGTTPTTSGEPEAIEAPVENTESSQSSLDEEPLSDNSVVGFPHVSATTTYLLAYEESTIVSDMSEGEAKEISSEEQVMTEITEAMIVTTNEMLVPEDSDELSYEDEKNDTYEILEDVSTPTEMISEGVTLLEEPPATSSILVMPTRESAELTYSFDGVEWFPIGVVDLLQDTQISFDLGDVSIEAVPSLRIRVAYTAPLDAPQILFQKPQLQLSYTPGEALEVPLGSNDQEPNFYVSSVHADVIDGTTRAVLLERGGVFELWVYFIHRDTGLPAWHRLVNGNALKNDTPVGVHGRTVFWFDQSVRTLLTYDVDLESLTSSLPASENEHVVTLRFGSVTRAWAVTYDILAHSFTFSRTANTP